MWSVWAEVKWVGWVSKGDASWFQRDMLSFLVQVSEADLKQIYSYVHNRKWLHIHKPDYLFNCLPLALQTSFVLVRWKLAYLLSLIAINIWVKYTIWFSSPFRPPSGISQIELDFLDSIPTKQMRQWGVVNNDSAVFRNAVWGLLWWCSD